MAGCERAEPRLASSAQPCLADSMRDMTPHWTTHPECELDEETCRKACRDGDRSSCFHLGIFVERTKTRGSEARALYKRACELGLSLGCVNYGAGMWLESNTLESNECARRIFALACDAADTMGCAMVGRLMIEQGTAQSRAQARGYLEEKCKVMKGPPCRMLAWYLERGDLGDYPPARLRELMTRACEGGDVQACREWKRVDDTFH
jgi:uncharacterized protein